RLFCRVIIRHSAWETAPMTATRRASACLLTALLLSCLVLPPARAAAPPAKVPAAWLKLIDQLGEEDGDRRADAETKLKALGERILLALEAAAKGHDDVDVRLRAAVLAREVER